METSRPAKLDVRSLTKANLDASGVADASPLSARSKLRRFASTSDLPPAIQPPRMVLTTMRFAAIVLSATLLARADAPRAGASLWGGAVLVSAGVIAFATSPPAIKERRKAHVSDPIPEEEA